MATDDKALAHAWSYFSLHAGQRLTVFNYFVVISGVLCTGLAATMQASTRFSAVGIALGAFLILASFLFWKLDERTSFLIKHAEEVITKLEPTLAPLMTDEVSKTVDAVRDDGIWTYGKIFRRIFIIMALIGLGGAVLSGLRAAEILDWQDSKKVDAVDINAA